MHYLPPELIHEIFEHAKEDHVFIAILQCINSDFRKGIPALMPFYTHPQKYIKLLTIINDIMFRSHQDFWGCKPYKSRKSKNHMQLQNPMITLRLMDKNQRTSCKITRAFKETHPSYKLDGEVRTPEFFLDTDQRRKLFERFIISECQGNRIVGASIDFTAFTGKQDIQILDIVEILRKRVQSVFPTKPVFVYDTL